MAGRLHPALARAPWGSAPTPKRREEQQSMRKLLCSLIVLALAFTAIGAFAANRLNPKNYPLKTVPKSTIIGKQVKQSGPIQADPHTMLNWKAVNKLSPAMNTKIK